MNIKENMAFVIKTEAEAISNINVTDEFEQAVNMLLNCKGYDSQTDSRNES